MWVPGNVNASSFIFTDVPIVGATLGDLASASFSLDLNSLVLSAAVNATDHVTVILSNNTSSTVNLTQGTLFIKVTKRAIT